MIDRLFLGKRGDGRGDKLSSFWILLVLAAIIATAGVVSDSTATVIGAMIVAPLMTPILGTALAVVLADRRRLWENLGLVLLGALSVVVVAFLLGLIVQGDVTNASNSQVTGRVSPRLIDLVAALATGLVGAFALIRSDVSDTLPGVAIAISLVPPLAVVGLTLEAGAIDDALGALLLFGTNVAAIIFTGTVLLLLADVRGAAGSAGLSVGDLGVKTIAAVTAGVLVVALPLGVGSWHVFQQQVLISRVQPIAMQWADDEGWSVRDVSVKYGKLQVVAVGLPPEADDAELRSALDEAGLDDVAVTVTLIVGGTRTLETASDSG